MLQIVKRRYLFFGLSLLVIIPGMLALILWGFNLAIDFTGGSLLDMHFTSGSRQIPPRYWQSMQGMALEMRRSRLLLMAMSSSGRGVWIRHSKPRS